MEEQARLLSQRLAASGQLSILSFAARPESRAPFFFSFELAWSFEELLYIDTIKKGPNG